MPFDDANFEYGGGGMPEKRRLNLTGVYKDEASGPKAVYCATGTFEGRDVRLPESSLKMALEGHDGSDLVQVAETIKTGGHAEANILWLRVSEVIEALSHIGSMAPANRPDPMSAVS